jgi:hypothetical protein
MRFTLAAAIQAATKKPQKFFHSFREQRTFVAQLLSLNMATANKSQYGIKNVKMIR